jgi:hypothetical protein
MTSANDLLLRNDNKNKYIFVIIPFDVSYNIYATLSALKSSGSSEMTVE